MSLVLINAKVICHSIDHIALHAKVDYRKKCAPKLREQMAFIHLMDSIRVGMLLRQTEEATNFGQLNPVSHQKMSHRIYRTIYSEDTSSKGRILNKQ